MDIETISKLAHQYRTPFYAFFEDDFIANFNELKNEYEAVYTPFSAAYSLKTNYLPAACACVKSLGGYAEVVSDHEYRIAKKLGFRPEKTIVNGPGKWYGMEEMISDGAIVMLDNAFELKQAMSIAERLKKTAPVGIRLNFEIGTNKHSRFGFDAESSDTEKAIREAREHPFLKIIGLHFHLSGSRSLEAWENRAVKLTNYCDELLEKDERKILDLGSGMFGHMHPAFAAQFNQHIPSFSEYAAVVGGVFKKKYGELPYTDRPELIVEPGTTVVANTMAYVTRVIASKTIRGREIAIVDGSVHQLGELGKKKQLPIHVVPGNEKGPALHHPDIGGFTCLEDDILSRGVELPIRVGDTLAFENAGAYSNVLKPPFIRGGCKIISCTNSGKTAIVKRDENEEDFLSTYVLPVVED